MLFSLSQMLFLISVPVPLSKFKSMATSSFSHLQMMLVGMNRYFWLYEFSSCSLIFFAQIAMLRDSYLLSPPRERPLTSRVFLQLQWPLCCNTVKHKGNLCASPWGSDSDFVPSVSREHPPLIPWAKEKRINVRHMCIDLFRDHIIVQFSQVLELSNCSVYILSCSHYISIHFGAVSCAAQEK